MESNEQLVFLLTWLLVSTRLVAAIMLSTLMSLTAVPTLVRLVVSMALSLPLTLACPPIEIPTAPEAIILMFASEMVLGAAMGFALHVVAGAVLFGGRVLDNQIGFSAVALLNPQTKGFEPLTGSLLLAVATVLFFAMDWHHTVLLGLSKSFVLIPPGSEFRLGLSAILTQFGLVFVFGVLLVAPLLAVLLAIDMAIAVASRSLPQFNVFFLSLPLKAGVAIIVLALMTVPFQKVLSVLLEASLGQWSVLLGR